MARVRVDHDSLTDLFRPGGTVEPISRADQSGRTRFNLETGLDFANRAMTSPALGVAGNLLARGGTALYRSLSGEPDSAAALRQQAAQRMGTPSSLDIQRAVEAQGIAASPEAMRDELRRKAAMRLAGMPEPLPPEQAPMLAGSLSGDMASTMPVGASQRMGAGTTAALTSAFARAAQQANTPSTGAADMRGLMASPQNPYALGATPNMQYLPEGAAPFSADLERAVAQQANAPARPPIAGAPSPEQIEAYAGPRPPAPEPFDAERRHLAEDDLKAYNALRKQALDAVKTGASHAELEPIYKAMHAVQDRMLGARMAPGVLQAPDIMSEVPREAVATGAPAPEPPPVQVVQTPQGPREVVRMGNTVIVENPRTKQYEMWGRGKGGQPELLKSMPASLVVPGAGVQAGGEEPAPAAQAAQPAALVEDERLAKARELMKGGTAAPAMAQAQAPVVPQLDEYGRSPEQVAEARRRAMELVRPQEQVPGVIRDRDQLLAMAAQARTPEEQADILRRAPDADVYGTTLADLLTGSHVARSEFARELRAAMPAVQKRKAPEELALDVARAEKERAEAAWYKERPGLQRDRDRALADLKRDETARKYFSDLDRAHQRDHQLAAADAKNSADRHLKELKQNLDVVKVMEGIRQFEEKIKRGWPFKPGSVNINMGNDMKALGALLDNVKEAKRGADETLSKARDIVTKNAAYTVPKEEFDQLFPANPGTLRPQDPDPADARYQKIELDDGQVVLSTMAKEQLKEDQKAAKEAQDAWDKRADALKAKRAEAMEKRKAAEAAQHILEDPDVRQVSDTGQGFVASATDILKGFLKGKPSEVPLPSSAGLAPRSKKPEKR